MTKFELDVLKVTAQIPFGETRTYQWVADKIGNPKRALELALESEEHHSDKEMSYNLVGWAYTALGDYENALQIRHVTGCFQRFLFFRQWGCWLFWFGRGRFYSTRSTHNFTEKAKGGRTRLADRKSFPYEFRRHRNSI